MRRGDLPLEFKYVIKDAEGKVLSCPLPPAVVGGREHCRPCDCCQ